MSFTVFVWLFNLKSLVIISWLAIFLFMFWGCSVDAFLHFSPDSSIFDCAWVVFCPCAYSGGWFALNVHSVIIKVVFSHLVRDALSACFCYLHSFLSRACHCFVCDLCSWFFFFGGGVKKCFLNFVLWAISFVIIMARYCLYSTYFFMLNYFFSIMSCPISVIKLL